MGDFIEQANDICKKSKFKAIKTIRMTLIEEFSNFFEKNRRLYDFKFIFLVRDPRGMMNSRLAVAGVEHPVWGMRNGCRASDIWMYDIGCTHLEPKKASQ